MNAVNAINIASKFWFNIKAKNINN